ncbi:PREDICTED: putative pentatricopeptide repeat-containing protein At5g40405 [Tarenaya hassleriana]|uniref:putative pentatricopeptide repeat-containing protein At5g40405 n=1 Tax=Tarenaya hassleriana TaxID=28532 RepID=UPI00053C0E19|nr:PREDICTED: putative pentatricopeptide repeat-containing protein At5g40405 [Tarenaya hassleriana]XP_010546498.1 PREDICTED: putative pentatricopeptide repeat-containing protein At5g40405 [Tarenaya hassleriana]XP_010546499.1 PREDICTED: putative pentatricopeptide repeat-containing protein At5g40405 [Tarenaya hassleriana]
MNRIAKHPFIALLDSGTTLNELRQIHNQLLVNGILNDDHLLGHFVAKAALSNPKNLDYARELLDRSHNPTLFALNSIIRAHCKSPSPEKSFDVYRRILCSGNNLSPDNYTINFMVTACTKLVSCEAGLQIHGTATRRGFDNDPHVQSGLISLYAVLGCLDSCHKVFSSISDPDVVCQTTIFKACAECGDIAFARRLFEKMPDRDAVAWSAMISGYAHFGDPKEALNLFHLMQLEGFTVNEVSLVSVLSACTQLGALDQGRWAHAYIDKNKIKMNVNLGTALIDFYAKCGDMSKAMEVFWGMKVKNVYTWSSMLNGLAMNGFGEKCLELFSLMKQEGIIANAITFVSVLRACSVVGLVDEGQKHFDAMRNDYGIEPRLEHYGCLVDLYGRAGRLDEALSVIQGMPMKPRNAIWGSLLNACRLYKNTEMAKLASSKLLELEDKAHGAYVLLSNIYAESNKWDNASHVREVMKFKGVRKEPGCSVMEINGEVHEFFVGDKSHPRYGEIEGSWKEISRKLRLAGYKADISPVLFDIEEEEKEEAVGLHSEKIAIAFAMISLKGGVPIRIVKNLRVCWDCHQVAMMVSKIFDREIIMRDRNRFHHFKDGECSCKGFW